LPKPIKSEISLGLVPLDNQISGKEPRTVSITVKSKAAFFTKKAGVFSEE